MQIDVGARYKGYCADQSAVFFTAQPTPRQQRAAIQARDRAQQAGRALYRDIKPILEIVPKLPLAFAMVVNKALEFEPDRRYQSPADMLVEMARSGRSFHA